MPKYLGRLNANEVAGSIFNMLIGQRTYPDNVDGLDDSLVSEARVEGGLYGDTKLYYATDALHSNNWGNDAEATNLLQIHRPDDPECQAITLDVFRQVPLTVDNYLSKRAWGDEYAFSTFLSVMLAWLPATKTIYDVLTYNAFIGTNKSSKAKQNIELELPKADTEEHRRLRAQLISARITDLAIDLKDVTRDYNDYGFLRSYKKSRIKVIWNAKAVTKITKLDLPTIFNDKQIFGDDAFARTLPERFFGDVNASGGTAPVSNTRIRSLIEKDYNTVEKGEPGWDKGKFLYPGDLIPDGVTYEANETYTVDEKVICKVLIEMPPFMSAFEVGTSFFNAKSLTDNKYLTWGHNHLEHLYNYPYITIKGKELAK